MIVVVLLFVFAMCPHALATHYALPSESIQVIGEIRRIDAAFERRIAHHEE